MLGKFIAGDFIAIAGEMRRFPASNENTVYRLKKEEYGKIVNVVCLSTMTIFFKWIKTKETKYIVML